MMVMFAIIYCILLYRYPSMMIVMMIQIYLLLLTKEMMMEKRSIIYHCLFFTICSSLYELRYTKFCLRCVLPGRTLTRDTS